MLLLREGAKLGERKIDFLGSACGEFGSNVVCSLSEIERLGPEAYMDNCLLAAIFAPNAVLANPSSSSSASIGFVCVSGGEGLGLTSSAGNSIVTSMASTFTATAVGVDIEMTSVSQNCCNAAVLGLSFLCRFAVLLMTYVLTRPGRPGFL
jgi:hypothetical protein